MSGLASAAHSPRATHFHLFFDHVTSKSKEAKLYTPSAPSVLSQVRNDHIVTKVFSHAYEE